MEPWVKHPKEEIRLVFLITGADVRAALDDIGVELSTGQFEELAHFVGDRFDNLVAQDLADAVWDFLDDYWMRVNK